MTFFYLVPAMEHVFLCLKDPNPCKSLVIYTPKPPFQKEQEIFRPLRIIFNTFQKFFPHKICVTYTCEMIWRIFKQCVERFGVLIRLMNLKGLFSVFSKRRVNWEGEKNSSNTSCHVLLRGKQGFVVEL